MQKQNKAWIKQRPKFNYKNFLNLGYFKAKFWCYIHRKSNNELHTIQFLNNLISVYVAHNLSS